MFAVQVLGYKENETELFGGVNGVSGTIAIF